MKKITLFVLLIFCAELFAQNIERVEPPNWWAGMNNSELELMVYGENIAHFTPKITDENIILTSSKTVENSNYLFLKLDLSKATAGKFTIDFTKKGRNNNLKFEYELKERSPNSENRKGFDNSDVIYLITPDRFANGDASNDVFPNLKEKFVDRSKDYARHGGDIKGITQHLDYIADMGFTAIWSTPLLINDMEQSSYHGYAITDLYKVDPRFGTLEEYIELSKKAKEKGVKMIMDHIANHIGVFHWWMKDLPMKDWVNDQSSFEKGENLKHSNHRRTTNQDLYASQNDKKGMTDGWFTQYMPDLNQKNPYMATYLIQNSIWWVETLDLGGIRQDTYPYPDKAFMAKWAGEIMKEYPNFSIVGEEWSLNPLLVAYWQQGAANKDGYISNLTSTMDFPMQRAIVDGLNEEERWDKGLVKLYEGLANDFAYPKPNKIMIFPDNHDMGRVFTQFGEDIEKTKSAVGFMLMLPRIPQLYYGTEILVDDSEKPGDHGYLRSDFPGGWNGDEVNAFTGKGLSPEKKEMQLFVKKVLNFRKQSEAILSGKTIHFAPENGVYVLFRVADGEIVATIINKNDAPVSLSLNRFNEIGLANRKVKNIVTGETFIWDKSLQLNNRGIFILTTKL